MNNLASPTVAGFTGPPPSAGVDMYKVVPTNGVYFGPYLRYTNIDLERGLWLGSILLVTDVAQPPTIHIHQSVDLSPNRKSPQVIGHMLTLTRNSPSTEGEPNLPASALDILSL